VSKAQKNNTANDELMISEKTLRDKIVIVRKQKVMLDYDLAKIYGYTTSAFNQQVSRNLEKFEGEDFMFKLTMKESNSLISQNVISSWGGTRKPPYAFTEQGIYMLMTILRGELAVKQSRALIRMFKNMKDYIIANQESLDYKSSLQLARQEIDNTLMKNKISRLDKEIRSLNEEMNEIHKKLKATIMKSEISPILLDFSKNNEQKEYVFTNGDLLKASEFFTDIYNKAEKSIYIIDNYASIKTLRHLQNVNPKIKIIIFCDNTNNYLHKTDYDDFRKDRSDLKIRFIKTMGLMHDRFIIIDYDTENEVIYHSGASEKDAGKKLMIVSKYTDGLVNTVMHDVVDGLMMNDELALS